MIGQSGLREHLQSSEMPENLNDSDLVSEYKKLSEKNLKTVVRRYREDVSDSGKIRKQAVKLAAISHKSGYSGISSAVALSMKAQSLRRDSKGNKNSSGNKQPSQKSN